MQGEANVSASNSAKVVSTVSRELFNINVESNLLCISTALSFSAEASVIAMHQVGDAIKKILIILIMLVMALLVRNLTI